MLISRIRCAVAGVALMVFGLNSSPTTAAIVDLTITIENLAPTNSVSFAPTRIGLHNGSFDPFNINQSAGAAIVSIAEGGSGSDWFPALSAADPNSVSGTIANGGPAIPAGNPSGPGNTATATFRIDTGTQGFFSFANMVVPSNDLFLGNDTPLQLFDSNGNLQVLTISQFGRDIWDANSEVAIPENGAFLVGSVNGQRVAENGLVAFDFSELSAYDGLTTAAGYEFDSSSITANTELFRITLSSVSAVPEPSSFFACSLVIGAIIVRRFSKRKPSAEAC